MFWTKSELAEQLREGVLEVSFVKMDGSGRTMKCSLMEKYLPPLVGNTESNSKDNPDVLAVWDIDNNGWRSFRIASIVSVKLL